MPVPSDLLHPNEVHYNLDADTFMADCAEAERLGPKYVEALDIQGYRIARNYAKIMLALGWESFRREAESE